jgi:hypothetical protein
MKLVCFRWFVGFRDSEVLAWLDSLYLVFKEQVRIGTIGDFSALVWGCQPIFNS